MHCSRFPSQYSQLFRILLRKNALFQVPKPLITFFHIFHILPRENALFKVPMPIITFFSHFFHILLRETALFKVPMPIITLFSHFFHIFPRENALFQDSQATCHNFFTFFSHFDSHFKSHLFHIFRTWKTCGLHIGGTTIILDCFRSMLLLYRMSECSYLFPKISLERDRSISEANPNPDC